MSSSLFHSSVFTDLDRYRYKIHLNIISFRSYSFLPFNYNKLNINRNDNHQWKIWTNFHGSRSSSLTTYGVQGYLQLRGEARSCHSPLCLCFSSTFFLSLVMSVASVASVLLSARYPHSLCLFFDFPLRGLVASRRLGARHFMSSRSYELFETLGSREFRSLPFLLWPSRGKEWITGCLPSITL